MKRPPGLWLLLSAGVVLWLNVHDVYGVRATSLIFGKTSTTTDNSVAESSPADGNSTDTSSSISSSTEIPSNVTKPTLTGNPQQDYIWDPNLPKELNGYNLSDYPFYERVPDEEIEFKCDGLHDGFYASVPHKCQVYHHCLFGTRFDFLCANYTAFDQKTFICHFASEVDCANSKKYWHRNDALYQAATTTTVKPVTTTTQPPPPPTQSSNSRPNSGPGGRRRPFRRRRPPQYDYYEDDYSQDEEYADDYYQERPARRRKRPLAKGRPAARPARPLYEEDYEEYEDDVRYDRRPSSSAGGQGNRRNNEESRPRTKQHDRRGSTDDRVPYEDRTRYKDRRRPSQDKDRRPPPQPPASSYEDEEDEEPRTSSTSSSGKRQGERRYNTKRRPAAVTPATHSSEDYLDDLPPEDRNASPKRKTQSSRPKNNRRPVVAIEDEYDLDDPVLPQKDQPVDDHHSKPMIKPTSGSSIYDRPRAAPRIKPPVPKSEASKFAYKPVNEPPPPSLAQAQDEEYYDEDYAQEEEVAPLPPKKSSKDRQPVNTRQDQDREVRKPVASTSGRLRPQPSNKRDQIYEEDVTQQQDRSRFKDQTRTPSKYSPKPRPRPTHGKKQPSMVTEDYVYEDYEEEILEERPAKDKSSRTTTTTSTSAPSTTTTSTTPSPTTSQRPPKEDSNKDGFRERPDSIVRIVKRPFLPSRGGSPYASRGLQPVGAKAQEAEKLPEFAQQPAEDPPFKASPVVLKVPLTNQRPNKPASVFEEPQEPENKRSHGYKPKTYKNPVSRTTQKPKLIEADILENLDNDEYDVTLNDALNPTLPNLPIRGYPAGFSSSNDYSYNSYQQQQQQQPQTQRQRYVAQPTNAEYTYQEIKPVFVRQRYESPSLGQQTQAASNSGGTIANTQPFVSSNADYKGQYSTLNNQNYRPRVVQTYYTSY